MQIENQNPIPPNHPVLNHKVLYTVLGVLLLVLIAGSYFWWQEIKKSEISQEAPTLRSEQSDVPSDWKTYTNTDYGFEFKYPSYFIISSDDKTIIFDIDEFSGLEISTENNLSNLNLTQWLTSSEQYNSKDEIDKILNESEVGFSFQQNELRVDDKIGLKHKYDGEGGAVIYVFLPNNNKIYILRLGSDSHFYNQENLILDFDQILSTFKFTN